MDVDIRGVEYKERGERKGKSESERQQGIKARQRETDSTYDFSPGRSLSI
jgi:hypothetical protein